MSRVFFAGFVAVSLLTAGCAASVRIPTGRSHGALSSEPEKEKCPPGHRWSDGRCHGKGKGHDPAKH